MGDSLSDPLMSRLRQTYPVNLFTDLEDVLHADEHNDQGKLV